MDIKKVLDACNEMTEEICYLCRMVNPQHLNCVACNDMDGWKEIIEEARGKLWRDPLPDELDTPEFNAVWDVIKHWDIGLPQDIVDGDHQLYSHATGNHVVAILDALRGMIDYESESRR